MSFDPGNPFDAARVAHEAGQKDMLAKCIAAVERFDDVDQITVILAALRALQEKP